MAIKTGKGNNRVHTSAILVLQRRATEASQPGLLASQAHELHVPDYTTSLFKQGNH